MARRPHQVLPDFNSWIGDLDLSSPSLLEDKIDVICDGVSDKENPANQIEYIKVMQSHLLLEVWSQIRIFMIEQYQKNEYFSNGFVENIHHNQNKNNKNKNYRNKNKNKNKNFKKKESFTATLKIETFKNNIQIPFQSYLLLLWKNKLQSKSEYELKKEETDNDNDNKSNDNNNQKPSFPLHVLVQVKSAKAAKYGYNHRISWDIKLSLSRNTFTKLLNISSLRNKLLNPNKSDFELNVIPIKNLIYLQRDYDSIRNINLMPLSSYIMGEKHLILQKKENQEFNLFKFIQNNPILTQYFNKILNNSQIAALRQSLLSPLSLIHGPPGTGKTKYTLLPILACSFLALNLKYNEINRNLINFRIDFRNNNNILKQICKCYKRPRIGVFAGSNQAIDEIILTILEFSSQSNNSIYSNIPISRIGNNLNMNRNISQNSSINVNKWIEYYLSFKWDKITKIALNNYEINIRNRTTQINNELKQIEKQIVYAYKSNTNNQNHTQNHNQNRHQLSDSVWENIRCLICKIFPLKLELKCLNKILKTKYPNQASRYLLPQIMNECSVLFSTSNYLGRCTMSSDNVNKNLNNPNYKGRGKGTRDCIKLFNFALFDESCQMRETETLISLQYCSSVVLIGDPQQLQATILYYGKYRYLLLNSLFNRLRKYIQPIMLNLQYRMNSEISSFPSSYFYGNKLLNAPLNSVNKNKLFHSDISGQFKPYLFYNISGDNNEEKRSNSIVNSKEILFIQNLLNNFIKNINYLLEIKNIGIITPYDAHKQLIQFKLQNTKNYLKNFYNIDLECVTVDEFQGSERDIILFSCVRSNNLNNIGFLQDISRLNVAITRAKYSLWIIGNSKCLQSNSTWNELLKDVKKRNLFRNV